MVIQKWTMAEMIGYEPITTFWQDFSIADTFGANTVKDTYNRAFEEWKGDYKYLTELVMVLNHKIWQHADTDNTLALTYNNLWEKAEDWAYDNLKDEELKYYIRTLD